VTDAAAGALRRVENTTASLALLAMVLLPIAEIVVRWFSAGGVPGSITLVQHLTLWVGFLGAALAARDGKLLALATATFLPAGRVRRSTELVAGAVAAAITALLAWGAIDLVRQSHEFNETIGPGIPKWIAQIVLPVSLVAIAGRLIWHASDSWQGRAAAASGLIVAFAVWWRPELLLDRTAWPFLVVLVGAALIGAPIFALLGGAGVLLNLIVGDQPVFMMISTYELTVSPTLPAIPLFTLAGFLLAEGKSSGRLLRVFRAWF
jgi:TRAP-type C4-dicarboxylate transport system permease small subunit